MLKHALLRMDCSMLLPDESLETSSAKPIEKTHFPVIPWCAPLITGKYTFQRTLNPRLLSYHT